MANEKRRIILAGVGLLLALYSCSYFMFRFNGTLIRYWSTQEGSRIRFNTEKETWRQLEVQMMSKARSGQTPSDVASEQTSQWRKKFFESFYSLPIWVEAALR